MVSFTLTLLTSVDFAFSVIVTVSDTLLLLVSNLPTDSETVIVSDLEIDRSVAPVAVSYTHLTLPTKRIV